MFVRIRPRAHNLEASLVETHRSDGRVRSHHIATLGLLPQRYTTRDYIKFQIKVRQQLDAVSPPLDREQRAAFCADIDRYIPKPITAADLAKIFREEAHITPDEEQLTELVDLVEQALVPDTEGNKFVCEHGAQVFDALRRKLSEAWKCMEDLHTIPHRDLKRLLRRNPGLRGVDTGLKQLNARSFFLSTKPQTTRRGMPPKDPQLYWVSGEMAEEIATVLHASGRKFSVTSKTGPFSRIEARVLKYSCGLKALPQGTVMDWIGKSPVATSKRRE
jgi:hypothetical protein